MDSATIHTKKPRQISPVWIIPAVAIIIGVWILVQEWNDQGILIEIKFENALGIEAKKTKIVLLNVEIGLVQSVHLNENNDGVIVHAMIDKAYLDLLRPDSEFWVVRPRVGVSGISGLGTILSGVYIEMQPGPTTGIETIFTGLNAPPSTPLGTPGVRLVLLSESTRSLSIDDPIIYKGFHVGRVETVDFNIDKQQIFYHIFIESPFDELVTTNSRFWNTSGLQFQATADGLNVQASSLDAILKGGIAFEIPEGKDHGKPVSDDMPFRLYEDQEQGTDNTYQYYLEYVMLFSQSVRGLSTGAPVEYRGMNVGAVHEISIAGLNETDKNILEALDGRIAVTVRIEPARLGLEDNEASLAELRHDINNGTQGGYRATIETGNLLTGAKYISIDKYPSAPPEVLPNIDGVVFFPTISSGIEGMSRKVNDLLDSLNKLPLQSLVNNADTLLTDMQALTNHLQQNSENLNTVLTGDLYRQLDQTLKTFNHTMHQVEPIIQNLQEKPNALIFDYDAPPDPIPGKQ